MVSCGGLASLMLILGGLLETNSSAFISMFEGFLSNMYYSVVWLYIYKADKRLFCERENKRRVK